MIGFFPLVCFESDQKKKKITKQNRSKATHQKPSEIHKNIVLRNIFVLGGVN